MAQERDSLDRDYDRVHWFTHNAANWLYVLLDELIVLILQLHWQEARNSCIIMIGKSLDKIFTNSDCLVSNWSAGRDSMIN